MVDDAPALSVVLGTYNRLARLKECLASMVGRISAPHEIVVVDAGSTDGTQDYLRTAPGIRAIFDGARLGLAPSLNRVFRTLASTYVAWISDDLVVVDGMLDTAVRILDRHDDIGLVGLKQQDATGRLAGVDYVGGVWPTGILNVNAPVLRRSLFERVGFLDEELRDYGTDPDLVTKVLRAGFAVAYTKKVAVRHFRDEGTGFADAPERRRRQELAQEIYARKHAELLRARPGRLRRLLRRAWGQVLSIGWRLSPWFRAEGYGPRDIFNVTCASYIALGDLRERVGDDHYLVQRLPPALAGYQAV